MTLPASFPLKASDINIELGRAGNAVFNIAGAEERALAQVPSGAIAFSNFLGKSSKNVTLVHTSTSASEVANYGTDFAGRDIVIIALGGNDNSPYTLDATISGVLGDRIISHSSGDGAGVATGAAIIVGQPSGTSGTVTVSGTATMRFYVLSVAGYDMSAAVYASNGGGAGIPPWTNVNVPSEGLTLSVAQNSANHAAALSFINLTERITDATLVPSHISAVAWDFNMVADPSKEIDIVGVTDTNGDSVAVIATFNPS